MGIYFIFVRPPLLPEDLRYMGLSSERLLVAMPKLTSWLRLVFTVLGGYIVGTGVLLVHLALGAFAERKPCALWVAWLSGSVTTGLMSVANLFINSHFKFIVLALTAVWLAALVRPPLRGAWLVNRRERMRPCDPESSRARNCRCHDAAALTLQTDTSGRLQKS
ncbi:hypothetical protein OH764_23550 [Burkholderia sp. M6-3]